MMLVILPSGNAYEKGAMPDAETVAHMTKYNEELAKAGVLLGLDGLHPTSAGARIRKEAGRTIVTDGPFAETREVLGGYWLIRVGSHEEALDWAKRAPIGEETIELRRIFDLEDFPADVQTAAASETVEAAIATT